MRSHEESTGAGGTATVVPSLGRWGLSAHADLVYRTLVLLGPATGGQLARCVGADAVRIRRALDELAGRGVVRPTYRGTDRLWCAVDVNQVLSMMRQRRTPPVIDERLRRHVAAVAGLHLDRIPGAGVRRLPSRAATRTRIAELVDEERHEHLAINTESVIAADAAAAAAPLDRSLLARGVRFRVLGRPTVDGSPAAAPAGSEYREADELPLKLMVFDRRSALFPADPDDFDAGALEITEPDAVAHLTQLFYSLWRTAGDPSRQEVPPIVLTVREQAIVTLLTAGLTEEAVAAELGLSRRTVVYTLRALMNRLSVETRWQLALVLGAAQAVPVPSVPQPAAQTSEENNVEG